MKKHYGLFSLCVLSFMGCSRLTSLAFDTQTAYLSKEMKTERPSLQVPKSGSYQVTTIVECPKDEKVKYNMIHTLAYTKKDGTKEVVGTKEDWFTSYQTTEEVESGAVWARKLKFKTRISHATLSVKIGDSTIFSKHLEGDNVTVDYGFKLP